LGVAEKEGNTGKKSRGNFREIWNRHFHNARRKEQGRRGKLNPTNKASNQKKKGGG